MASEAQERTALFGSLAERLLKGEAGDDESRRAHLLRLLGSLMPAADRSARKALIAQVADMPSPPKDLALRLATDDADIATPLLRKAPFSQPELIELVTRSGPEHHIEIAKRADLTLDVWLALARAAARRARIPEAQDLQPHEETAAEPAEESPPQMADMAPPNETPAEPIASAASNHTGPGTPASDGCEMSPTVNRPRDTAPAHQAALPLSDADERGWRFETDREGCLTRVSPNIELAFGQPAHAVLGDSLPRLLQSHAAAPSPDEVGDAMRRRVPLRELVVETLPADGLPQQWVLSAQPRFSFPDGRFEGYIGAARDREADFAHSSPLPDPAQLLDRLGQAADKLARSAATPELAEYGRVMKDYVEALKLSQADQADPPKRSPRRVF